MRRQDRTNSFAFIKIAILAIVDYILLMGFVWGNYAFFACFFNMNANDMAIGYVTFLLGSLSGCCGIALLVFLYIKNRFIGFLVTGLALISYGIAFIVAGALSEDQTWMIIAIVIGLVFIGAAAGCFLMALTEFNKQTTDGGLNLDNVEHRGRVFGQNAGVNIQTNRGPTIANV